MLSVCPSVCVCVRPCVPGRKHSRSACPPLLVVYLTTLFQTFRKHFSGKFCAAAVWGATALWDSWDASPPTCENLGTKCIWSPSDFCDWPSFMLVSTLCNGRQMYIVDRMTKFKLTIAETMSGEAAPEQSGGADCAYSTRCVDLRGKVYGRNV